MTICNKGALVIDQCAHRLMETWSSPSFIPDARKDRYTAFYHEDRLFSVWDSKRKILALVYAGSRDAAIEKVRRTDGPDG